MMPELFAEVGQLLIKKLKSYSAEVGASVLRSVRGLTVSGNSEAARLWDELMWEVHSDFVLMQSLMQVLAQS